ncbi:MAG: hypothetical protein SF052_14325 [Bacteroidia bacterium]|nr:hypothetical protein [Bacteroidia bacterium]
MKKNFLLKSGYYGTDVLWGVELFSERNSCLALLMRNRKGNLEVLEQQVFEEVAELIDHLQQYPGVPIVLKTHGLSASKWIPAQTPDPVREVMGLAIGNRNDFLIQTFPGAEREEIFAVISRKEPHYQLFENIGPIRQRVIYHYFSDVLLPFLIPCAGDLELEEKWLPLYSAMFYAWVSRQETQTLPEIFPNPRSMRQNQRWVRFMVMTAILFLGLAFMNIGVRSIIFLKRSQTEKQLVAGDSVLRKIAEKQQLITKILETAALRENRQVSRLAVLSDRIAAISGPDIVLDNLIFFPTEKELRKIGEPLVAQAPDILIKGQARTSGAVFSLVTGIGEMPEAIKTQLFSSEYDYNTGRYEFVISGFMPPTKPIP